MIYIFQQKFQKKENTNDSERSVFQYLKRKLWSFNAQNWWTDYLLTIFPQNSPKY